MISFERINFDQVDWISIASLGEINVFQTQAWLQYLNEQEGLEPVIVAIRQAGKIEGYFTGMITRKFGLKILGSPFRGWNTYFMGFNLTGTISRSEVMKVFPAFVFKTLGCHYLEIIDPDITESDYAGSQYQIEKLAWYSLDLALSEDELFKNMKHACRTNIRKAMKSGVFIEETDDLKFADDYYAQYAGVMKRHSLEPVCEYESVKSLIRYMLPAGNLLLLRARDAENTVIATGLFLHLNRTGVFWGAASNKEYLHLRPNEFLAWEGMKALKAKGVQQLHLGGHAEQYKEKFGCCDAQITRLMLAGNPILGGAIKLAVSPRSNQVRNLMLRWL